MFSGSILTGGNIFLLFFWLLCPKDCGANIGFIAILMHFKKTLLGAQRIDELIAQYWKLHNWCNLSGNY